MFNQTQFSHIANGTWKRSGQPCGSFRGTTTEWHLIVTAGLTMAIAIIFANIANLLVFRQWKKKHPFLHFHVALSYAELGYGCVLLFAPASYLFDTQQVFSWPKKVTTGGIPIFAHICHSLLASMSIDRWLSTEFPVVYKNTISTRKVTIIIAIIWMYYLCQYTTVYLLFHKSFEVMCNKVVFFGYRGKWWVVLQGIQYPILVAIMILTQLRMVMLAVRAKLCVRRSRRVVNLPIKNEAKMREVSATGMLTTLQHASQSMTMRVMVGQQARSAGVLLRSMWKTVLAGSVVVCVAIAGNLPVAIIMQTGNISVSNSIRTVTYLVSNFQYVAPTLIYISFYANFRRCLGQIFGRN